MTLSAGPTIVNATIDWSREPADNREKAIRLEVIRQIEIEWSPNVYIAIHELHCMQDATGGAAASDLVAAIARLEASAEKKH